MHKATGGSKRAVSTRDETMHQIQAAYGVENWASGYFDINSQGHLCVRPVRNDPRAADMKQIVDSLLASNKVRLPLLLRFPQLLTSQLQALSEAYQSAITEFEYSGQHFPLFPMKVNPRREVVEQFLREGTRMRIGLECGSKAELYAAMGMPQADNSLLLCNGFKDETFIRAALMAVQAGKRVVVVIEKLSELVTLLRLHRETKVMPMVGLRAKLYSRGSGKWSASGGDSAKFGLTTSEILESIRMLREADLLQCLKLLHFHIGSQITDIKRVKNTMKEAARVYAKLRQIDCPIEFVDIGGGLGVDYDGSKTRFESSVNYSVQEFANGVVYPFKWICDEEDVPHPHIVTESGRFMTAFHAVFITCIREEIETFADDQPEVTIDDDDPQVITELKDLCDNINGKNYAEYYHDALQLKDELQIQFNLGLVSLEDRAKGDVLFWEICARSLRFAEQNGFPDEEFEQLKRNLASKYLCNFSLFRSAPDSWAIRQLFPVVPIHRLNEPPSEYATLVDVTCDSDGKIDRFVDLKDVKQTLEVHSWTPAETYYLGIFLVGAYQEVMGSFHNLFGNPNEAHVVVDSDGQFHVKKIVRGSTIADMMEVARYDLGQLHNSFDQMLRAQVDSGALTLEAAQALRHEYVELAQRSTYLE
ncbi:MAG: biosynthetic arginine decarboxylase [Pirellulaceae bacterium]|nr:MAG: biosynthetic arginine decarboxylase [Pirellulaceae bacterium]